MSRRGNRCTQIFTTNFGWSCSFPLKLKSEAHEALSLLFQRDRVSPTVICDNAKEMVLGEFNRELKKASCQLKQTKPFTPWSNKKDSDRKLIKSSTQKRLWNDCLELESYIRSNAAHGIYKLDGVVPKMIMSGKMTNIIQFCEFEWLKWVMF